MLRKLNGLLHICIFTSFDANISSVNCRTRSGEIKYYVVLFWSHWLQIPLVPHLV